MEMENPQGTLFSSEFSRHGLFYKLRTMQFPKEDAFDFIDKLRAIDVKSLSQSEKMLAIRSLWSLPFLASLWKARCLDAGASREDYSAFLRQLYDETDRKIDELTAESQPESSVAD